MRAEPDRRSPVRVVAIQIERLGDLVVSTPALRRLRDSLPGARISLVCAPSTAGVLRGWDAIDDVVAFDPRASTAEQAAWITSIRTGGLDLSVTLTSSRPAYALARRLGGPQRAGVVYGDNIIESALAGFVFTHPVRIWVGGRRSRPSPVLHRAEELLRLNAVLGLDATPAPLELPIDPGSHARAAAWLAASRVSTPSPVALHLARGDDDPRDHGRWLGDGWTDSDLLSLVERLRVLAAPAPVVVTAGPEDQTAVSIVERAHPRAHTGSDGVLLVAGTDVHTWAAVLARTAVVVTPNTGAVHVAAAVGRPVVAVYPKVRFDVNSRQWAPYRVPHRTLIKGTPSATIAGIAEAVTALRWSTGTGRLR